MSDEAEALAATIAQLDDHTVEKLMFAVMDRLVGEADTLPIANEDEGREFLAAAISTSFPDQVDVDSIAPATATPVALARTTLAMLADDPTTAGVVRSTFEALPDDTQMIAEPITLAVVIVALVAFLQTKFQLKVERVGGKLDVEFSASKEPTSPEMITKVLDGVRRASIG